MGFFQKLKEKWTKQADAVTEKFKEGLSKTRDSLAGKVNDLIARYRKVDEEFFEELEEILFAVSGKKSTYFFALTLRRVSRFQARLTSLLEKTPEDHPDHPDLIAAIEELKAIGAKYTEI